MHDLLSGQKSANTLPFGVAHIYITLISDTSPIVG